MNPYQSCPHYETQNLNLRLVKMEDAQDLLKCYSDPIAVAKMNPDSCTSDFYYTSIEQMQECIAFWLRDYQKRMYVRFSLIPKQLEKAVGTVEMFGSDFPEIGRIGVLRIDLASEYETPGIIAELTALSIGSFLPDFSVNTIVVKAGHTPERARVFKEYGFSPTEEFRPGSGYHIYKLQ